MNSLPSFPKWIAPPLWFLAEDRVLRLSSTTSLPGTAILPFAVKRLTRLWMVGVLAV